MVGVSDAREERGFVLAAEMLDVGEPWPCQYCRTVCVDYPTLKAHQLERCRILKYRPYSRAVIGGEKE